MARYKWSELTSTPEYKKATPERQEKARVGYFEQNVAPDFDESEIPRIRKDWDDATLPKPAVAKPGIDRPNANVASKPAIERPTKVGEATPRQATTAERPGKPAVQGSAGVVEGFKDFGRGIAAGVTERIPEAAAGLLDYSDTPEFDDEGRLQGDDGEFSKFAREMRESAKKRGEDWQQSEYGRQMQEQDAFSVRGSAYEAGSNLPLSFGGGLAGAATGAAVAGPGGAAAGFVIGSLASLPLFFGIEAKDTYDQVYEKVRTDYPDLTDEQVHDEAMNAGAFTGGIEAGGELVADLVGARLFKMLPAAMKKDLAKAATKGFQGVVPMVKEFSKVIGTEVATELAQGYAQEEVRASYGVGEGATWDNQKGVIMPTILMSLVGGGAAIGMSAHQRYMVAGILENPKQPPERRLKAAEDVARVIATEDQELGQLFYQAASQQIAAGKPVIAQADRFYRDLKPGEQRKIDKELAAADAEGRPPGPTSGDSQAPGGARDRAEEEPVKQTSDEAPEINTAAETEPAQTDEEVRAERRAQVADLTNQIDIIRQERDAAKKAGNEELTAELDNEIKAIAGNLKRVSQGQAPEPTPRELTEKQAAADEEAITWDAGGLTGQDGEPAEPRPVLQNRDRTKPSSIEQMARIAAAPDYAQVSFSRDFANGAPVVEPGAPIYDHQLGKQDVAIAADGRQIPVQYAVVEAADLLPSNEADGTPIKEYAEGLDGMSRAIAGNGRVAGLQRGFEKGTTNDYVDAMAADSEVHGVDASTIQSMENPILVRIMPQEEVTDDIGDVSNTRSNAELTPGEQAVTDTKRIDINSVELGEDGEPTRSAVEQFIASMPEGERGALRDGKQPNKRAYDRLGNAVFAEAYQSEELLRLAAEATEPEIRTIMAALKVAAGKMSRLAGTGVYDIRALIVEAAETAVNAKRNGDTLATFLEQGDMGRNPYVTPILEMMAENNRSAKKMGENLSNLADVFYNEASRADEDMFGEVAKRPPQQLMDEVYGTGQVGPQDQEDAGDGGRAEPGEGSDVGQEPVAEVEGRPEEPAPERSEREERPADDRESESEIDAAAAELAALLKPKGDGQGGAFRLDDEVAEPDPQVLAAGVKLGGLYIKQGTTKFEPWARAIIEKLSSMGVDAASIKPHLKGIYAATQQAVSDEQYDQMDDARAVRSFDLDSLEDERPAKKPEAKQEDKKPPPGGKTDLFGAVPEAEQSLADAQREKDEKRDGKEDVPADMDGGLFSNQQDQTNIFDVDPGQNEDLVDDLEAQIARFEGLRKLFDGKDPTRSRPELEKLDALLEGMKNTAVSGEGLNELPTKEQFDKHAKRIESLAGKLPTAEESAALNAELARKTKARAEELKTTGDMAKPFKTLDDIPGVKTSEKSWKALKNTGLDWAPAVKYAEGIRQKLNEKGVYDSTQSHLANGTGATSMGSVSGEITRLTMALSGYMRQDKRTNPLRRMGRILNGADKLGIDPTPVVPKVDPLRKQIEESVLTSEEIDAKANEAASSPQNDLADPTPPQIAADNYKKGEPFTLHGQTIVIENPRDSMRGDKETGGKKWQNKMAAHYGDIKGTVAADGDNLDVFVGENPESERIFIVDQQKKNGDKGGFDEHKVFMGFVDQAAAEKAYLDSYAKGWKVGPISELTLEEFKDWIDNGNHKKALQDQVTNGEWPAGPTEKQLKRMQSIRDETGEGMSEEQISAEFGVHGLAATAFKDELDGTGDTTLEREIAKKKASKAKPRKKKPKRPPINDRLKNYFRPGRIVPSYAGTDRVIGITFDDSIIGGWSVDVVEVDKDGNDIGASPRNHATVPSEKLLLAWEKENPVGGKKSYGASTQEVPAKPRGLAKFNKDGKPSPGDYFISSGALNEMYTLRRLVEQTGLNGEKRTYTRYVANLSTDFKTAVQKAREYLGSNNTLVGTAFELGEIERRSASITIDGRTMTPDEIVFDFGKHDGKTLAEVLQEDSGYIEWMKEQSDQGAAWIGKKSPQIAKYLKQFELPEAEPQALYPEEERRAIMDKWKVGAADTDTGWVITGVPYEINGVQSYKSVRATFGSQADFDKYGTPKGWRIQGDYTREEIESRIVDMLRQAESVEAEEITEAKRLREEADKSDSDELADDKAMKLVSAGTAEALRLGEKFGIPKNVVNDQIADVGKILDAYNKERGIFLLANEAGTGKTFVLGGAIREMRSAGAKKFVYITMNQDLISQIKNDLAAYGVDDVQFDTYANVSTGKSDVDASGAVVIFDETHNVGNIQSARGKRGQDMMASAEFTVMASATPFENPAQAQYMAGTGFFEKGFGGNYFQWLMGYGGTVRQFGDTPIPVWTGTKEDGKDARQFMFDRGVMTYRPMQIPADMVDSIFIKADVEQKWVDLYEQVDEAYAEALEAAPEGSGDHSSIKMHRINVLKRILEASKVEAGIKRAQEHLEAGRNPILFVETKSDRHLGRFRMSRAKQSEPLYEFPAINEMMLEWMNERDAAIDAGDRPPPPPFAVFIWRIAGAFYNKNIDFNLPSTTDDIIAALGKKNVAIYTGSVTNTRASKNLQEWRDGTKKVLVATMDKGGTGLSLHDTVGDHPTAQVNINLPWVAKKVDQVSGRSARYGLQSPAIIEWLFSGNIPFEEELAARVGRRMADMGAVVKGNTNIKAATTLTDEFDFEGSLDTRSEDDVYVAEVNIDDLAPLAEETDPDSDPDPDPSDDYPTPGSNPDFDLASGRIDQDQYDEMTNGQGEFASALEDDTSAVSGPMNEILKEFAATSEAGATTLRGRLPKKRVSDRYWNGDMNPPKKAVDNFDPKKFSTYSAFGMNTIGQPAQEDFGAGQLLMMVRDRYDGPSADKIRAAAGRLKGIERAAFLRDLLKVELITGGQLMPGGLVSKNPDPDYWATGTLEVSRLRELFDDTDSIWNLRNGEMAQLLREAGSQNPAIRAGVLENPAINAFATADPEMFTTDPATKKPESSDLFTDATDTSPRTNEIIASDKTKAAKATRESAQMASEMAEMVSGVWSRALEETDNLMMEVEFEHTVVFARPGEAISYFFGMSGSGPQKTYWGDLVSVKPLPDVDLDPHRMTYAPKNTNKIYRRQVVRNEMKRLLGEAIDVSVSVGRGVAPASPKPGILGTTEKGMLKGKNDWLDVVANTDSPAGEKHHPNKGTAQIIIDRLRMSPMMFYDIVKGADFGYDAMRERVEKHDKTANKHVMEEGELIKLTDKEKYQQRMEAQAEWDAWLQAEGLNGKYNTPTDGGLFHVSEYGPATRYEVSEPGGQDQISLFDETATPTEKSEALKTNFATTTKKVPAGELRTALDVVNTAEEVAHLVAPIRKNAQESMMVIATDQAGKVLMVGRHTMGLRDSSSVDPLTILAQVAGVPGAAKIHYAHNHPSGTAVASEADQRITKRMLQTLDGTGIEFGHHVIVVGGTRAARINGDTDVQIDIKPGRRDKTVPIVERQLQKRGRLGQMIDNPEKARRFVEGLPEGSHVVLLDAQNAPVATVQLTEAQAGALRSEERARHVLAAFDTANSGAAILSIPVDNVAGRANARNLAHMLNEKGVRVLDVVYRESESGTGAYTTGSTGQNTAESRGGWFRVQDQTQTEINGSLKRVDPNVRKAVNSALRREGKAEATRIRKNLKDFEGTAWAVTAIKGLAIREYFHQATAGKADGTMANQILDSDIWGDANMRSNHFIKAFAKGPRAVEAKVATYEDFISKNRKAETSVSGSMATCDPTKNCAEHCYDATGLGGNPWSILKSEVTEWAAKHHPDLFADNIERFYWDSALSHAGLSLRLNDKGDLSPALVELSKTLADRNIPLQIFTKRPDLLGGVPDMHLKMLSVDASSDMKMLERYPDFQLAITLTDDMTDDMLLGMADRAAVILPVNLKGREWTTEELKARWPKSYPKFQKAICPVEVGLAGVSPGSSYVDITNPRHRTQRTGAGKKVWTCTSCDKLGTHGCFYGANQTVVRRADSLADEIVTNPMIDRVVGRINLELAKLVKEGVITDETKTGILASIREGGSPVLELANVRAAEGLDPGNDAKPGGAAKVGEIIRGGIGGPSRQRADNKSPRGATRTRPSLEQVQEIADKIGGRWNAKVNVIADMTGLPDEARAQLRIQGISSGVTGYYDRGAQEIFIIAGTMKNKKEAEVTILHEGVGHMGVERVMGKEMGDFLKSVYDIRETDPVVKKAWDYVNQPTTYGRAPEAVQAAEIVARIAESNPKHTLVQRFLQMARQALRKMGFDVVFKNDDIIEALRQAKRTLEDSTYMGEGSKGGLFQTGGLDMSKKARLKRAREQGFDTETVWYHGTARTDIGKSGFRGHRGVAAHLTRNPKTADTWAIAGAENAIESGTDSEYGDAATVYPVYIRAKNTFDINNAKHRATVDIEDHEPRDFDTLERLSDEIKGAGFDSYLDYESNEEARRGDTPNIAIFEASNARSVNAAFDPTKTDSPNILARVEEPAPPFYSGLAAAAERMKQAKGTPEQMLNLLRKQAGVRQEELEWTGLGEYLEGISAYNKLSGAKPAAVTKEDIVGFLESNGVQVETVILDSIGTSPLGEEIIESGLTQAQAESGLARDEEGTMFIREEADGTWTLGDETRTDPANNEVKYDGEELSVFGGTNYREVLLKLPENIIPRIPQEKLETRKDVLNELNERENPVHVLHKGQEIMQVDPVSGEKTPKLDELDRLIEKGVYYAGDVEYYTHEFIGWDAQVANYKGGHYGEHPNVLTHIRMDDRVGANGEKILFIEEIQSDWHQAGKKYGYADESSESLHAAFTVAREAEIATEKVAQKHLEQAGFLGYGSFREAMMTVHGQRTQRQLAGRGPTWEQLNKITSKEEELARALNEHLDAVEHRRAVDERIDTSEDGVPNAPFKGNAWVDLAAKRIIRLAAEEGYDRVSWTTGEQQAERYDLSKQVEAVKWEIMAGGEEVYISMKPLYDYDSDGSDNDGYNDAGRHKIGELDDVVGKELADKIREEVDETKKPVQGMSEGATAYARYMGQRTWESEEKAREYLSRKIMKGNRGDPDSLFGTVDPGILDEFTFVKSGNEVKISQAGMKKRNKRSGVFDGVDLKVGGEGLRTFYDKNLRNVFGKVSRKLDKKAQVTVEPVLPTDLGTTDLGTKPYRGVATLGDSFQAKDAWLEWGNIKGNSNGTVLWENQLTYAFAAEEEYNEFHSFMEDFSDGLWKERKTAGPQPREDTFDAQGIDITPDVKEGAMGGQVLFRVAEQGSFQGDTYTNDYLFRVREKPAPKKTVKAYKLFRLKKGQPGKLFPLFVMADDPIQPSTWLDAESGDRTPAGKVKSKIGALAYRPGWHTGDAPIATHIGIKTNKTDKAPSFRNPEHVWAEVEVGDDVDWQTEANRRAERYKTGPRAGKIKPVSAHITDQVPEDGFYRYKTNHSMEGNWLIAGTMRVNRLLSDKEVAKINKAHGYADLPRQKPMNFKDWGFPEDGALPGSKGPVKAKTAGMLGRLDDLLGGGGNFRVEEDEGYNAAIKDYEAAFNDKDDIAVHNAKVEVFEALWEGGFIDSQVLVDLKRPNSDLEYHLEKVGDRRYWSEILEEHAEDTEREDVTYPSGLWEIAELAKGTTDDIYEAGYVLPDGTMLDFSGKRDGGPPGDRAEDHRQLGFNMIISPTPDSYSDEMIAFQKAGAVRIDAKAGSADMETPPTFAQIGVIEKIMEENIERVGGGGHGYMDMVDGSRKGFVEITDPSDVRDAISRFYAGGKAEKSLVQQYRGGSFRVEEGLDMSKDARLQRARDMGFDTDTYWYHGTPDARGIWQHGFRSQKERLLEESDDRRRFFFAKTRRTANTYADDRRAYDYQDSEPETVRVYLRPGKTKTVDWKNRPFRGTRDRESFNVEQDIEDARAEGYNSIEFKNIKDSYNVGDFPDDVMVVFDPVDIRSTEAAFDPRRDGSRNIMFRVEEQASTPEFKKWFGESKVTDADGKPLVVYRGEHGRTDQQLQTRNPVYTFGDRQTASDYAMDPNDNRDKVHSPRVIPAYLKIEQPYSQDQYSSFWDFSVIEKDLGRKFVDYAIKNHPDEAENTGWWMDEAAEYGYKGPALKNSSFQGEYGTIQKMWKARPDLVLKHGYMVAFPLADDQVFVDRLKELGHDGIIHDGYGMNFGEMEYKVFDKRNIKSAIGNQGTFDSNTPNILFRANDDTATLEPEAAVKRPFRSLVRDRLDAIRYEMQDKLIDLKRIQEGQEPADYANAYQKAAIWEGRAGERLQDFDEERVQPLLELVAQSGLSWEEVGEWLVARHANEANVYLAEINEGTEGPDRYRKSGMSSGLDPANPEDNEAQVIMDRHANRRDLWAVGNAVDELNRERVEILVNEGLITQATANAWQGRYQHYVPLMREEAEGADHLPSRGQGFNIKGRESKMRVGSAYWTPSKILANTIAQYESTVVRAEKNKVGLAMLEFVRAHPDPSFWHIDTDRTHKAVRNGQVVVVQDGWNDSPNELTVKEDGKEHIIAFNLDNERAARLVSGLKNLQAAEMGAAMRAMAKVTRFLATINTSWNPEFMVSNFFRDVQTAAYNLSDTDIKNMRSQVIKDIPSAMNGIRSALFGDGSAEWAEVWDDFRKHGGKTGWMDLHGDIIKHEKNLKKMAERLAEGKHAKGRFHELFKGIENANNVVENGVRLAAYKHAITPVAEGGAGLSKDRAAALAKDLTVNFNRKGAMGSQMNAAYMFYNAAVQGNIRLIQAMVNSAQGRRLAYATVGFAVALDIINRSLAGDDDDGENLYDELPDYVKDHNIVVMGEKEPIIKLPAPWGYNVLHTFGQVIGEAMTGERFNAVDAGARLTISFMDAFNPVGSGTFAQVISPTITDPIVQMAENKTFSGQDLKPEHTFDSRTPRPEYLMRWSTSREASNAIAKFLNDQTGGNEVKPGNINISPEWIDLVVDHVTGGAGRTVANTLDTATRLVSGEDTPRENMPFVRKVTGYNTEFGVKSRYYEWSKKVAYAKAESKTLRGKDLIRARRQPQHRLIPAYTAAEKRLTSMRKMRREMVKRGADDRAIENLDKKIREVMSKFNKTYAKAML